MAVIPLLTVVLTRDLAADPVIKAVITEARLDHVTMGVISSTRVTLRKGSSMLKIWIAAGILCATAIVLHGKSQLGPSIQNTTGRPGPSEAISGSPAAPQTFAGYQCTDDCSGHEAGYDWAETRDIENEDTCDSLETNSESFKEGCKAFVSGDDRDGFDDEASPDKDDDEVSPARPTSQPSDADDEDDDDSLSPN